MRRRRGSRCFRRLAAIPSAELVIIPSCGHLPQEERPQEFLTALANFADKLSSKSQ